MENVDQYYLILYEEVARHLEDSETSKLSHFNVAEVYERRHKYWLGLPTTIAALLLAWLVSQKDLSDGSVQYIFILKITLSFVVAISSGVSTFLNFNEQAGQHRKAALKYQDLWRKCKNWKTDFPDSSENQKAKSTVQEYRNIITNINQESPQIPKWAWKSVAKQQKEGSTEYVIDKK